MCEADDLKLETLYRKFLGQRAIKLFSPSSRTFFELPKQRLSCAGDSRDRDGDECAATLPEAKSQNGF